MTIPFLGILKKAASCLGKKGAAAPEPAATKPSFTPVEKPSSERLSKTVMPNSVRQTSPNDSNRLTEIPGGFSVAAPRAPKLPPSVALALQPKVERTISLRLQDFMDQIPAGYLKPVESFDPTQRVLLKASEVERGMAAGKPTVAITAIYDQVPDVFLRNVKPDDITRVGVPFEKVLEQFQKAQVRNDQDDAHFVPQVDTPILQAAIEDTQRFGTTMEPVQNWDSPPVRVEPMTARAIAGAVPETLPDPIATTGRKGIPLNPSAPRPKPTAPPAPVVPPAPASEPTSATTSGPTAPPTRIPFHLPPNGTGGPAAERVPASSGPSVPPSAPIPVPPPRVPFKVTPPSEELKPKRTLVPGVAKSANAAEETAPEPAAAKAPTPTAAAAISPPAKEEEAANKVSAGQDDQKISLSLRAVLQCMPAFQLTGSVDQVKEEARIEFPFSLVERQLAQGRIAVPAQTFVAALPEEHRGLFKVDEQESPVLLPLHEVLKNLPASALKMREDQEAGDVGGAFETPFSIKAAEDAQRFVKAPGQPPVTEEKASTPAAPAESKAKEPRVPEKEKGTEPQPAIAEKTEPAPSVPEVSPKSESLKIPILKLPPLSPEKKAKPQPPPVELQEPNENGGTEANTNAKDIVSRASELEGVAACSVTFEDGLGLAGNLPDDVQAGGLCAMAPSVLQKMNRHTAETKLGPLVSMTLHCRESQMSFFMQGNVCLTILHKQGPLPPASYESLTKMATELSRTYSQPETVHVDH